MKGESRSISDFSGDIQAVLREGGDGPLIRRVLVFLLFCVCESCLFSLLCLPSFSLLPSFGFSPLGPLSFQSLNR